MIVPSRHFPVMKPLFALSDTRTLVMWSPEDAKEKDTSIIRDVVQRPQLRGSQGVGFKSKMLAATLAVVLVLAAYEFTQFVTGSCQGYGGVGAFESSLAGQALGFWSIDPLNCR